VDVDIGADDEHQRTARAALLGDDGLREHLPQGGLAGGIAGLVAAGEVEEQVHELGRRRVARLRRRQRGEEQQGQREAGEAEISHASIPSVAISASREFDSTLPLVGRVGALSAFTRVFDALWRRGGGRAVKHDCRLKQRPPPPTPPHKGEGSTPSTRRVTYLRARHWSVSCK